MIPLNLYPEAFPQINVADTGIVRGAAGPGIRFVIWAQGCLKRCVGCANASFLSTRHARLMSVDRLLNLIDSNKDIVGITLSGGEPVLQALAITPLLEAVRERGLSIGCYSGYTLEELSVPQADPALRRFIELLDWLVDGEFRPELPRGGKYRPSSNQQFRILREGTPRADPTEPETVYTLAAERCTITGTLPTNLQRRILKGLRDRGVLLRATHPSG